MVDIREDQKALELVLKVFDVLKEVSPAMPIQQAELFLLVALREGLSMKDIMEITGAKKSTISRQLTDLGRRNRRMEPGHMLIEVAMDDFDMRKNLYQLTDKGQGVIEKILKGIKRHANLR